MTTNNPKNLVPKFFDKTSLTYEKIVKYATFGKDNLWKKEILKEIKTGISFLDLACGTGILTRKIAEKFPNAKIIGVDITPSYLEVAKKKSSMNKNIFFINQDAEKLNLETKFDYIVSSYIPKYCKPQILVKKCIDHLNLDGQIIFHDFTYPKNNFVRLFWNFYFVLLNLTGYFIPNWKVAFKELPKLIKSSNWLEIYSNEMKKNGLEVNYRYFTWHSCAILIGKKSKKIT